MKELYVYIATKGALYSVLITEGNDIILQETGRMRSFDTNIYIRAMQVALSHIQNMDNSSFKVNFILPNDYLKKWIEQGFSKPECKEDFDTLLDTFHSIPMKYSFLNGLQNKAVAYIKDAFVVKPQVSSASSLLDSFTED